ncbi:tRNA isopentenyl-2-thiomethyl-A-37 hydroxylase MiaE [Psychromonas sp. Urea-02u-13]|uniref:tRNA isopentenyl-2-thiomethyl-A-37 hydroxylase MiaE n=1 Tax=Psychromonas sp. Urea-02u-13 TaxID=2058326 RepID=UPI000C33910C|nr:tRNA isopentenyl-2-thiomethyl-A-37 hydroxylase MiaE [Psychromonas sp. Urea-02u-13]PKG40868.1 tRNA-(ms[2]io[6]A)-hydroxylase [Psychromonas sp. Urea-02u-13]
MQNLLAPIEQFLHCATPDAWIEKAKQPENLNGLLIDHMICELKAAQTAMFLIRRYAVDKETGKALLAWLQPYQDYVFRQQGDLQQLANISGLSKKIEVRKDSPYAQDLVDKMVLLIKEELHHFYQVVEIIEQRGIKLGFIDSSRYAKGLLSHVTTHEPDTLIDKLICGAYIEARSCERFAKIAPFLDAQLNKFYISLLRSEARHYQDYLALAEQVAGHDISDRIKLFGEVEAELISTPDSDFKFHSGVPIS